MKVIPETRRVNLIWYLRIITSTDYWADDTLGGLIVYQQRYRPSDSNTNYWADDTLGGLIDY
jgi:hypothetical protein